MNKTEFLAKFGQKTKTITVEAWDNMEVEIKQLSVGEGMKVQATLFKGQSLKDMGSGNVNVDLEALSKSTIQAVSYAMVEPKLTIKDLESMGNDGLVGINEVKAKLDEWDKPKK